MTEMYRTLGATYYHKSFCKHHGTAKRRYSKLVQGPNIRLRIVCKFSSAFSIGQALKQSTGGVDFFGRNILLWEVAAASIPWPQLNHMVDQCHICLKPGRCGVIYGFTMDELKKWVDSWTMLELPPRPSNSQHPGLFQFLVGNPEKNLHLWLASCVGGRPTSESMRCQVRTMKGWESSSALLQTNPPESPSVLHVEASFWSDQNVWRIVKYIVYSIWYIVYST